MLLFALRTGARQGEIISTKPSDVDFENNLIHIERNLSRGEISTTKSGKDRKVDMSAKLAEVLSAMISKRRAEALEAEIRKPASERIGKDAINAAIDADWLFQTPAGTQIDPSNLRKMFGRLLKAPEPKTRRIRFHDLRHTYASLLLEQRESLTYVKEQMGHSSINVTVDIYGHLVPGGNREAVNKLDDEVAAV